MFVPLLVTLAVLAHGASSASVASPDGGVVATPLHELKTDGVQEDKVETSSEKPHVLDETDHHMGLHAKHENAEKPLATIPESNDDHDVTSTSPKTSSTGLTSDSVKDMKLHQHWNRHHQHEEADKKPDNADNGHVDMPQEASGVPMKTAHY